MRTYRNAHTLKRLLPVAFGAARYGSRNQVFPRKIVGVKCPSRVPVLVDLIDRDPFLLAELLIEVAPIGREIGAVSVAWRHAEIAHFQYVARLGAFDIDRAGHDMDARIAVGLRNFTENRLDTSVEHQIGIIAGMMCHGFGLDQIAAFHLQHWGQRGVEISPMDGFRRGGKLMQGGWRHIFACAGIIVAERHE